MSLNNNEKVTNFRLFSPRAENSYRKLDLSTKNNMGNFNEFSKFSNIGYSNPINLYYSPKNITSPKNSKIPKIYSPLHRKLSRLYRSSSQNDIKSRPLSCNTRALPSVQSFSSINSTKSKTKNNARTKNSRQSYYNLEKEKLYQETYQIKKVVKILMKKLSLIKQENYKRDKQINTKQKKINDIINNNNDSLNENNYLCINNNNYNNNNSFNDFSLNSSINDNKSINSNFNKISKKNSPTINLCLKIKKAISKITDEIKEETEKYEHLKKSLFLTKMRELKTESVLLEEQINKIKVFINKAFVVEEDNNKKKGEYLKLKESINKQKELILTLDERANMLEKEEVDIRDQLKQINKDIKKENKKININKNKLNILVEKNNNLSNDKNLLKQTYTIKINNNPVAIKSFYTNKISELNKLINFFSKQCKYSDNLINKLKEQRAKLKEGINENKKEFEYFSINKNNENKTDIEKINDLKKKLKESIESEKQLKKRLTIYQNKLKELENPQDQDDLSNKSQIEFGIDNDNPYYIDDSTNMPEKTNKFTSSQFNQFTYILFKNFESKGISQEESRDKIINKFIEFNKNNNIIDKVPFASKEFDLIVDGYSKIILDVLNCNNKYNYTLTHIFMSALFFNSECNVNKLIEYFNVLFGYTRNYKLDEGKFILKLQNKYKQQTEKLVNCIKDSILNDSNSSKYFHLLKMKELLEHNEISLKDKYIEFLFYYMKKFDDPEAKLGDLDFTLLNDIIPMEFIDKNNSNSNHINIINGKDENININDNFIDNSNSKIKEEENERERESERKKEDEKPKEIKENKKKDKKKEKIIDNDDDDEIKLNDKKSVTDENFSKKSKKMNTNNKDNSDDIDDDEDSMTEITNEEYIKQLTEAISLMQDGLKEANTSFDELMGNVVQKRKLNGIFYECITIEDFNDQLKSINVVLSDLKLSCLCSKYSIPNELRLIDKNKIEKDIEKHIKGTLKLDEEENDNDNSN